MLYKIVRHFQNGHRYTVPGKTGLYLDEAKAHCSDPETSSRTATSAKARRLTLKRGAWFDGYAEDRGR